MKCNIEKKENLHQDTEELQIKYEVRCKNYLNTGKTKQVLSK
jgi:hypothetical protein